MFEGRDVEVGGWNAITEPVRCTHIPIIFNSLVSYRRREKIKRKTNKKRIKTACNMVVITTSHLSACLSLPFRTLSLSLSLILILTHCPTLSLTLCVSGLFTFLLLLQYTYTHCRETKKIKKKDIMSSSSSLFQSFQKRGLPVSQTESKEHHQLQGLLRRRISLNNIQPPPFSSISSWPLIPFHRSSKSPPISAASVGSTVRKWWDWALAWILSRKPTFAKDLEMNQEETALLGSHNRGSMRHLVYKLTSHLRRIVGTDDVTLPQTTSFNYHSQYGKTTTTHHQQG